MSLIPNSRTHFEHPVTKDKLEFGTIQRVHITNPPDFAIPVYQDPLGIPQNIYNEITSVASGVDAEILTYIVPPSSVFVFKTVKFSGDNYAIYRVEIDGQVKDKERTFWNNFNGEFDFGGLELPAGSVIKVLVDNFRPTPSDFNAKITGLLRS